MPQKYKFDWYLFLNVGGMHLLADWLSRPKAHTLVTELSFTYEEYIWSYLPHLFIFEHWPFDFIFSCMNFMQYASYWSYHLATMFCTCWTWLRPYSLDFNFHTYFLISERKKIFNTFLFNEGTQDSALQICNQNSCYPSYIPL